MFPNINPKNMQKMMKQMGIKTEEIEAEKVIIKGVKENIIIENPSITITEMQGKKVYSISGEEKIERKTNPEDIELIMSQTKVEKEKAEEVLKETNGDIAEAILKLKQQ